LESFVTGSIDIETPQGEFTSSLFAAVGKFEKRLTGQRVKQAMRARTRAGVPSGGTPRYGFAWDAATRTSKGAQALAVVPAEAKVVVRIHTDYANGRSQRAVQRTLNAEGVPAPGGGFWQQSAISRILGDPLYAGKLTARHDDKPVVIEGAHDAIVDDELWNRVQAIRAGGSRKAGQHSQGAHLLVRGALRCGTCGSAMIPDRGRGRRDRYICRGRVEHGATFCPQVSILREHVDQPWLASLLDGHIDFEATVKRIEQRQNAALTTAQEALAQTDRDSAAAEAKLVRVRGHYQEGRLEPEDWAEQRTALTAEHEASQGAAQRARNHVDQLERTGALDAEQALLDHLTALKQAVSAGVGGAPDLLALRNVIGDTFESVTLVRGDDPRWSEELRGGAGLKLPGTYWLVTKLKPGLIDWEAGGIVRQELPVATIDAASNVTG
jgi:site-specific DNA recombinase